MQSRDKKHQQMQQVKQRIQRDDRSLNAWLLSLPTPYFHPKFATGPSNPQGANQVDPFAQRKYVPSTFGTNAVTIIPVQQAIPRFEPAPSVVIRTSYGQQAYRQRAMPRFEPPLAQASSSYERPSQPKRKLMQYVGDIGSPLVQTTVPYSNQIGYEAQPIVPQAQVAFEPDPENGSYKRLQIKSTKATSRQTQLDWVTNVNNVEEETGQKIYQDKSGRMMTLFAPDHALPHETIQAPDATVIDVDLGSKANTQAPQVSDETVNTMLQSHQIELTQNDTPASHAMPSANVDAELSDPDESYLRYLNW